MIRVEPSNNSVEDRGKRIVQAQRMQDKNFATMVNTEGFTNFRFTQRAKNILSPIHVQAGEIAGANDYIERKRQLRKMGSNVTLNSKFEGQRSRSIIPSPLNYNQS